LNNAPKLCQISPNILFCLNVYFEHERTTILINFSIYITNATSISLALLYTRETPCPLVALRHL